SVPVELLIVMSHRIEACSRTRGPLLSTTRTCTSIREPYEADRGHPRDPWYTCARTVRFKRVRMLLFAPNHSAALARRIADALGTSLSACEEREFDGGEHKMRPLVEVRGQDVFVVQSLYGDAHASANDKLCRLLFFIGALKDAGASRVTACLPYLAYSRKDRRTQPNDPVTTRYIAALFESVGVDRIVVLDVHNEAAFDNAFRCETIRVEAADEFADQLALQDAASRVVVASPDTGGIKRAQRLREVLERKLG